MVFKPIVFVERQLYKATKLHKINSRLFNTFNVLSAIATFIIVSLSTIIISKIVTTTAPPWYFYATTVVTSIITFITSMINFFYIKDLRNKYLNQKEQISKEILMHELRINEYKSSNRDFVLFHRVSLFMGYNKAKEVDDE